MDQILTSERIQASVGGYSATEILFFNIADKSYGIDIAYVKEIIGIDNITIIPKIPKYIKGVINIRGKVVPIISVRKRFGIDEIPYDDRTCIIVLELNDAEQVGIVVDRVQEVITINHNQISKTPDSKNVNANKYIKSIITINEQTRLFLDCEKMIEMD